MVHHLENSAVSSGAGWLTSPVKWQIRLPRTAIVIFLLFLHLLIDGISSHYHNRPPLSLTVQAITWTIANTIGLIRLRKGYLASEPALQTTLTTSLKPFDIIVIAAPFKGSSFFTPGRNTHLAIWLGDAKDWRRAGWDNKRALSPLYHAIKEGRSLLQADRHGVTLSALADSLDADAITIYHGKNLPQAEQLFERIKQNMGRAYDYNLDGLDQSQLICTELIARIFPQIPANAINRTGRQFILPDQMLDGLEKSSHWQRWFHASPRQEGHTITQRGKGWQNPSTPPERDG